MLEHLIKPFWYELIHLWFSPITKNKSPWGAWFDHGEARVSYATREVPSPPPPNRRDGLVDGRSSAPLFTKVCVHPTWCRICSINSMTIRDQYSQDNCLKRVYFLQCMVPGKVAKCSIADFVGDVSFIAANCVSLSSMLHSNGSWSS